MRNLAFIGLLTLGFSAVYPAEFHPGNLEVNGSGSLSISQIEGSPTNYFFSMGGGLNSFLDGGFFAGPAISLQRRTQGLYSSLEFSGYANLGYVFDNGGVVLPFLEGGVGYWKTLTNNTNGTQARNSGLIFPVLIGGFKFKISQNVFFNLDAQYNHQDNNTAVNQIDLQFGISAKIGG